MRNNLLKGAIYVGFGASVYGVLTSIVKFAYAEGYTTAEVTSSQFAIGFSTLLILNIIQTLNSRKVLSRPFKPDIWKLLLAGSSLGFTTLFYYLAVQYISVSLGIILLMQSVWMGIVAEAILEWRFPSFRKVISTIVILLGTILATNVLFTELQFDIRGVILGLLAALSYAITMFTSHRIANYLPALRKSFIMLSGGVVVIALFLFFTQVGPYYFGLNFSENTGIITRNIKAYDFSIFWKYGLFFALFGTILPPILLNIGFPLTGLGLGSIITSLELPVATLAAYIVLNEQVIWIQWTGILIILAAIVYMNLNSVSEKSETTLVGTRRE